MAQKRVMVTGAAGFLGSYLCERLLAQGAKVYGVDCLHTGQLANLKPFEGDSNFEFVEHDIINPLDIQVDQIFNFACPASPPHYQEDPIWTWKTSVLGVMNLVELAMKYNARILHASTSECYGDPLVHPQPESYWGHVNPIGIRSCYDEGKRAAETLLMDAHRFKQADTKFIRIFNTYGPRMRADDGRVVSNFVVQALQGVDLTLYGDGNQTRSFCYAEDLVDVIFLMMAKDNFVGPVNTGNPGEFTMKELASLVLELTGSKSKLTYRPLPQDDPKQRKPDIRLAKEKLGWEPKIPLREGLKKTIAYFDGWLKSQG
ncbi:MAG: NAD-dependent dehydratase [Candidatus Lambdaproteobacteria bacterium RIFOXYD1_FULL_56_27]|uniref:UDP-glucuronate decarboxylase n=1 Tax=Candidatus Lambdaproteobacteria bacterium RIFOXYD2_FULL_56_26 TaxID=1817773 RepID=A0A1F6GPI1_9PROT|nr:MAG: NAD-dependent dehydratase [Candidatus Lambdaproteobacteria bacterium RIFOXYD2_FULL_56_26]OGH05207.1 MAG: NAD-dependent dehydratase [Candidatus Lambdaproteobacteria bacterium RIFOXYC1_FULL_56_13]OGH09834.1 MAG: NAD-dependent dehydratase [Candidatus Lambdaproteobacteria bacterium RIFOXYD1_FULL_56_27]